MKSPVILFYFLFLPLFMISCATDMTTARVEGGIVEGYAEDSVCIYKGIPFAAPPVGCLRWKAPQPVVAWKGIRSCKTNPPSAMQDEPRPFFCWSDLYLFSHVPPGEPYYGAFHSAEVGYALDNLKQWNRPFTEADYKLADIISSYWVSFAERGDPNDIGLPLWPSFDESSKQMIEFGDEVKTISLPDPGQFEIFDEINDMKKTE